MDNKIAADVQSGMMAAVARLVDRATVWLLRNRRAPITITATADYFVAGVETVRGRMPGLLRDSAREFVETRTAKLRTAGVPDELATHVACLDILFAALNVVIIARNTHMKIEPVTDVYFELAFALSLDWLHERIYALPVLDHWDRGARAILRDELSAELRELTTQLLRFTRGIKSSRKRIERWLEHKQSAVAHYQSIIADLKSSSTTDLAMLSVAVRQVRSLAREGE